MQNATIKVTGISCSSCVRKIEGALEEIGVKGSVNLSEGQVDVSYDDAKVKLAEIEDVIRGKGYQVAH
ncbi:MULTISPECIES: heavy-metal-associated domain-containing protein [Paenibacillus]|jgi:copper chaperone|uniref:HMA domain-containing protein n=1 Tax=Paenibacillus azoreducens TaxID=116718 RepID=A0A920CQM9_9BACL|nr:MULTISPECIES: heavy metal-associated domain-containing protein [Paenibacillus]MBE9918089.1 heavy-metal-associated domain-containing protein [Paenibacillus donghaensis]GIO45447.1 hypothetical protein J34TS1_02120 [Paenibacillus azoreducens]